MESGTTTSCSQKRMGPAPFASFEDLSDEMDSPGEKEVAVIRLPGISEQDISTTTSPDVDFNKYHSGVSLIGTTVRNSHSSSPNSLAHSPIPNKFKLVNTPRIDISRASSSSHHDSRDSTPEREIFENADANTVKLGFKEDDALELRLSTEELDFHDTSESKTHKYKHRSASPEFEEMYMNSDRKDSQCSDVILLSISGRTSRLSSIGSQGSAQSRLSNASHISITSGHSAYSQCSSPHKTLVETSFCGHKGSQSNIASELIDSRDDFEKILLSRKSNPNEAIWVEGVANNEKGVLAHSRQKLSQAENPIQAEKNAEKSTPPRRIISKSGVEYIYIPLKGPMPVDDTESNIKEPKTSKRTCHNTDQLRHKNRADKRNKKDIVQKVKPQTSDILDKSQDKNIEPKYIRIKLKPDHCYNDYNEASSSIIAKPDSLNLLVNQETDIRKFPADNNFNSMKKHARSLTNSPKLLRKEIESSSPSPSVPRRNSFATLFRTGLDSPAASKQKRKNTLIGCMNSGSHSKGSLKCFDHPNKSVSGCMSSTESVDSKGKHKSVLSLFKFPKDKLKSSDTTHEKTRKTRSAESRTRYYKEEKPEMPLSSESIRIPLHSPTYYENKSILQELQMSSQDSQITVVEIAQPQTTDIIVSPITEEDKVKLEKKLEEESTADVLMEKIEVLDTRLQTGYDTEPNRTDSTHLDNGVPLSMTEGKVTIITGSAETSKYSEGISPHKTNDDEISKYIPNNLSECSEAIRQKPSYGSHSYDDHNSSESERDIELEYQKCDKPLLSNPDFLETERKAIVFQQDSFEDELPYVPTTLPQERSAAIPILPIRQRYGMEMKTFPIDRPRSTTPIHSSGLENYFDGFAVKSETTVSEKLKISLPRNDLNIKSKTQTEPNISSSNDFIKCKDKGDTPPPLPPKGIQKSWINFEEVPERRKPPKRIQTIPSRGQIDISGLVKDNVIYTYVNPEECKCECHEHKESEGKTEITQIQEDEIPLLTQDAKKAHLDR